MQHKMKFEDFALLNVKFSLNENYSKAKKKEAFQPEVLIDHNLREKEKELAVILGLRQIEGNVPFYFEVRGAGLFGFDRVPESKMIKQLATINCPAILFPYVRETIADLTRRAGFRPLHIDPVNFIELAKERDKELQAINKKKRPTKKKRTSK